MREEVLVLLLALAIPCGTLAWSVYDYGDFTKFTQEKIRSIFTINTPRSRNSINPPDKNYTIEINLPDKENKKSE